VNSNGKLNIGLVAARWWGDALGDHGAGRAAKAKLRRCASATDALMLSVTHDLHERLQAEIDAHHPNARGEQMKNRLRQNADTLALMAIGLANLRQSSNQRVAALMRDRVSALRFQRIMRITRAGELIHPLRRALAQIDGHGHVPALANDLYWWAVPEYGDRVRNDWCFAYYGASSFGTPTDTNTDTLEEIIE
jgi:CRISPR type I-E-associated protein CasB/Cse2